MNAKAETGRVANDAYFTPPELALKLVGYLERDGWLPNIESPRILEPSSGGGAFVAAAREYCGPGARITAIDLAPPETMIDGQIVGDFLDYRDANGSGFDLILGNPPYAKPDPGGRVSKRTGKPIMVPTAEEHVRHAIGMLAPHGVLALLLRLAFLESKDRRDFWRNHHAEAIYVLSERPTFTDGGTDNSAYGFFVWQNRGRGRMRTEVISWR